MPKTQRKHRTSEQLMSLQNKGSQHVSKKQKRSHSNGFQYPPAFWDNLSKIDLTKRALKELDRRNAQAALHLPPAYPRSSRPITQRNLAEPRSSQRRNLRHCGTRMRKGIEKTARQGGPDLSDLRDLPDPLKALRQAMSSSRSHRRISNLSLTSASNSKPSPNTTITRSTGPYNRNFQQNLIDGGIYPHAYRYPDGQVPAKPKNWEAINRRLLQPRPSLSSSRFSEEEFEDFIQVDANAAKERQVTTSVIPIIEGDTADPKCVSGGIPFTHLDPLTDGTLAPGNPDIYYGARPEQLDRRVRDELSGHIIPSTQEDLPIVPNFFLAAKGPDGSSAVAGRQASYDGALGSRGMHSLQSYGLKAPIFYSNAFTITSIYHGGQLKMYTSHLLPPASPGGRPGYHVHQLRSFAMTDTVETFRQGATCYRNGRDWAEEQREEAIRQANERARDCGAKALAVDASCTSGTTVELDYRQSEDSRLNEVPNTTNDLLELDASSYDKTGDLRDETGAPVRRSPKRNPPRTPYAPADGIARRRGRLRKS
ncbi:hypothetical protein MMC17_005038 [Xylographa soralifera]|nr:hypothetical protein [Xylographa soralifera]